MAIDLVSKNPGCFAALIVENTFVSLPALIPDVVPVLRFFAWMCSEKWMSAEKLTQILEHNTNQKDNGLKGIRMLLVAGAQDELIPRWHMDHLWSLITSANPDLPRDSWQNNSCKSIQLLVPSFNEKDAKFKGDDDGKNLNLLEHQFSVLAQGTHNDTCLQPDYHPTVVQFIRDIHP